MTGIELKNQWSLCLEFIRDNVSKVVFDTWFSIVEPVSLENGDLTIQVPSPFVYEYLEQNYLDVLRSAIIKVFGKGTIIDVESKKGAHIIQFDNMDTPRILSFKAKLDILDEQTYFS